MNSRDNPANSSQALHDRWIRQQVPLRFQLSDLTLWSAPLRLRVQKAAPGNDDAVPADPLPGEADAAGDGFLIRAMPLQGESPPLTRRGPWLVYIPSPYTHYRIDLRIGFERYKAKFSSKTRSTITRKLTRFTELTGGKLQWRRYTNPDEMVEFRRHARSVSARTYQERLLDAGLPEGDDFVAEMTRLAAADAVRAFILFHGERPVSYLYCPVEGDTLIYAYLGYDPDYLKHSAGTVLFWTALQSLFNERRFACFDFTEGESEHKRLFATHGTPAADVFFLWPTWRLRTLTHVHHGFASMSTALGEWLERHGMRTRIRRLLRFGRRPAAVA
jgi:CelD/BcsL family acetyltransferase involved in cellulose biosynthesis